MSLSSCYLLYFGWLPLSLQMVAEKRVSDPGVTFSGQGLQSNEGGFLFKPLGFCNLPELVPLSQQTWSRNLREELGGM